MINPKSVAQPQSNPKTHIYMPLVKVIKIINDSNWHPSIETLSIGLQMWMKQANQFEDLSNVVLCIDAKDAPHNFNYLALIRALTTPQADKDVHALKVAGIVVGGILLKDENDSSVLEVLDAIAFMTRTSYLHWRDTNVDGTNTDPLVPIMRGLKLTGTSAVLVHQLFTDMLLEDYTQEFTYKLLTQHNKTLTNSAASSALKALHNKYPAILTEQRIDVPRPNNKGMTSSYKYKLTGYLKNEQTPCNTA